MRPAINISSPWTLPKEFWVKTFMSQLYPVLKTVKEKNSDGTV